MRAILYADSAKLILVSGKQVQTVRSCDFKRGERLGQAVPRWGKNFLRWIVRSIARKLGIPDHLVTFQVTRRTLGTDLREHGTLKDAQGALRHASIRTRGDVYMQTIESSVLRPINSRTMQILDGWEHPVMTELDELDRTHREGLASGVLKQLDQLGPSWSKFGREA